MVDVLVRTPLSPSEDPAKVTKALLNLFPRAAVTVGEGHVEARTDSLRELRALIRKQKILDTARRTFLHSLNESGDVAVFRLNKQAAVEARVSFPVEGGPLGDLVVTARAPDLEDLLKEMAPMTIRGIPVSEERAEQEIARRRAHKAKRRATAAKEPGTVVEGDAWPEDGDDEEADA